MMNKLLIPQWFKKYPLNLRVKLRFFNSTVKPISYPSYPHLPHGFRLKSNGGGLNLLFSGIDVSWVSVA